MLSGKFAIRPEPFVNEFILFEGDGWHRKNVDVMGYPEGRRGGGKRADNRDASNYDKLGVASKRRAFAEREEKVTQRKRFQVSLSFPRPR